jgi:hypothetical protein
MKKSALSLLHDFIIAALKAQVKRPRSLSAR